MHIIKVNNKDEGPSEVVIPKKRIQTCAGCKHHKHQLARSGKNPIYNDNCMHETIESNPSSLGILYIHNMYNVVETPKWCPLLQLPDENIS